MAEASGYPYPDPERVEALQVVVDDQDRPVMAAGAQRINQIFLWCGPFNRPLAKLHAVKMLHDPMIQSLKKLGYDEANAFIPPEIERSFGKRLRSLGWVRNWTSFARRF